jgi:PRTRC genetic system protein F
MLKEYHMQLNSNELHHLKNAIPSLSLPTNFQLPSLHESIPRKAQHINYQTDFGRLGEQLLAAGVIDPESISEDAITPVQIVEEGLKAWFMHRIGNLQHMRLNVRVLDAEHANAIAKESGWADRTFECAAIALTGDITELRYVKDIAHHVESKVPELFLTAFTEFADASYKTIEIQQPIRILEIEASYALWGNDLWSVTDEEAREGLLERHGEEETTDYYMPDQMLEAFGHGFCFSGSREGKRKKKQRKFPDQKLKKLAGHEDSTVAAIASQLLKLRHARKRVSDLGASFCEIEQDGARPMYASCVFLFSGDDREAQFMDDESQYSMESGEGTELYSLDKLPETAAELKPYFQKLDALFDLIAQMDALIPKISYSPYAE